MRERPILFSGSMVRAILAGAKTVTRRTVRFHRNGGGLIPIAGGTVIGLNDADGLHWHPSSGSGPQPWPMERIGEACPYGGIGDRLWVRETWRAEELEDGTDGVRYAADDSFITIENTPDASARWSDAAYSKGKRRPVGQWRPSIFLPRWASRITLDIVSVRVERLDVIDDADALREGVMATLPGWPRHLFAVLWDEINGARSPWSSNPWVWRVEFRRVEGPR